MIEIITDKWNDKFNLELPQTRRLQIVSPFITDHIIRKILTVFDGSEIEVITRFNLNDFRSKVSSIRALERLIQQGAKIRGICKLHSKLYIFDNRSAIITSANLTNNAFYNNYEFGVKTDDAVLVNKSVAYFKFLQKQGSKLLDQTQLDGWKELIRKNPAPGGGNPLPDFGAIPVYSGDPQYFIKFLGSTNNRVDTTFDTKEEISRAHCHFALCYPKNNGRPVRYKNGDVVFIARLISPNDYAIFGRATAMKYDRTRDYLPGADLAERPWKENYPYYIRIQDPIFLDTVMGNCPKMSELIEEFQNESFFKLQKRHLAGETGLNPKDSLRQRADIQLSTIAGIWLEETFASAESDTPLVGKDYINGLYPGAPYV